YDMGGKAGLHKEMIGGGGFAVIEDFDGDGYMDLLLAPRRVCEPLAFFAGKGDGFSDESRSSGLRDQLGVTGAYPVDFDNDGDMDLYLTRGAWDLPSAVPHVYNTLLENVGGR